MAALGPRALQQALWPKVFPHPMHENGSDLRSISSNLPAIHFRVFVYNDSGMAGWPCRWTQTCRRPRQHPGLSAGKAGTQAFRMTPKPVLPFRFQNNLEKAFVWKCPSKATDEIKNSLRARKHLKEVGEKSEDSRKGCYRLVGCEVNIIQPFRGFTFEKKLPMRAALPDHRS